MRLVSRVGFALLNLFTSSCTNHLKTQSKRLKVIVIKQPKIILHKLPASCLCMSPLSSRQVFFFSFQSPLFQNVQQTVGARMPAEGNHVKLSHYTRSVVHLFGDPLDEGLCCCPCLLENTFDFTDCQVLKKINSKEKKDLIWKENAYSVMAVLL